MQEVLECPILQDERQCQGGLAEGSHGVSTALSDRVVSDLHPSTHGGTAQLFHDSRTEVGAAGPIPSSPLAKAL